MIKKSSNSIILKKIIINKKMEKIIDKKPQEIVKITGFGKKQGI